MKLDQSVKTQVVNLYRKALREGVSLEMLDEMTAKYTQRDEVTLNLENQDDKQYEQTVKKRVWAPVRIFATVLPIFFLGLGLFLIGNAVIPITSYYLTSAQELRIDDLRAPIPPEEVIENLASTRLAQLESDPESSVLSAIIEDTKPIILNQELDYTNLANWFDDEMDFGEAEEKEEYSLSIPKINIEDAEITIGGTKLDKSLIQYPGTAGPGEIGSPVIFGHSVLRQFYNPDKQNPRRYNSIFSTIMTLNIGDKIYVTKDGVKYTYQVVSKREVKPEDTYILMQRRDSRLLKLVTCVPEGTYLRRGVITAALIE